MGFGKSIKRAVGGVVNAVPGGNWLASSGALGAPGGFLESAADADTRAQRAKQLGISSDASVEQINAASLFSRLTPEQQKDLLINNPNIVTPEGGQTYDPYTNTIKINESEFTKSQRLQQERLANELAQSLSGTMPSTDSEIVRQTTYDLGLRQLQPQLKSQRDALATQLANQGIPINSEAYNSAMNRLDQAQASQLNELSMQSVLQGIQTAEAQRTARFNEISSLLGRSQVGTGASFGMFQPRYQGLDLMGAEQAQLNRNATMDMAKMQNKAMVKAAKWQAGGQLLGAGIGAAGMAFSDIRLKEKIKFENKVINKLPIYSFEYKNKSISSDRFIGVMAQDVEKEYPNAVIINKDGFKMVDYSQIGINLVRLNNGTN